MTESGRQRRALQPTDAEDTPKQASHDLQSQPTLASVESAPPEDTRYDDVTVADVEQIWSGADLATMVPGMTIRKEVKAMLSAPDVHPRCQVVRHQEDAKTEATDYELLEVVGEGGMGVVYLARQACIDRTIAIKMIRGGRKADPHSRAKFLAEAVVTGDLDHPNIVPVHELGTNEEGHLFYAMKHVQGVAWLKRIQEMSLAENLEVLMRVADAVAFSHARGVIHRDLKPENVMLGDYGEVLVMDWGLAASVTAEGKANRLTHGAALGGTPAYMAPEMARGDADAIGIASDVYLLGAILFEILTGECPHSAPSVTQALHMAACNGTVLTEVTGELMDIARKAMASRPSDRYASVKAMQQALQLYRNHAESIDLAERAAADLQLARDQGDYQAYARALFGFQEAVQMWPENLTAKSGATHATYDYAQCARGRGDLDLALSLLTEEIPSHQDLRRKVRAELDQRRNHEQRLWSMKLAARVLAAGVIGILAFSVYRIRSQSRDDLARYEQETMAKVQRHLRASVDLAYGVVETNLGQASQREYLKERYGPRLKGIVEVAMGMLSQQEEAVKAGRLSLETAQQKASAQIRAIRYDQGAGYLWINDMGTPFPKMVMHPIRPALNGQVLDAPRFNCALGRKTNLFVAFREACNTSGEGYVDYLWPKPSAEGMRQDVPKLSYVQCFKPWGWVVGTGVYVDDAREDAIAKSKADLRAMRFDKGQGYFWINDMNTPYPKMVMHPILPALEGSALDAAKYNCVEKTGENLFVAMVQTCRKQGDGFVSYKWPKPSPTGLKPEAPKLSYVRLYKPLGWVIGCGTYTDDVADEVARRTVLMERQRDRLLWSLAGAVGVIGAGAVLVLLVAGRGRKGTEGQ